MSRADTFLKKLPERYRGVIGRLVIFSLVVNVLVLVQPIFMLQVYDRVLLSSSYETLIYISLMAAAALVLMGVIEGIRSMVANRAALDLEVHAGEDAARAAMLSPRAGYGDIQPIRDLQAVRNFLSSRTVFAVFDLPFTPLFIAILYLIHPYLFLLAVAGICVLVAVAVANQMLSSGPSAEASKAGIQSGLTAQAFVKNADSLHAMGMTDNLIRRWGEVEARALQAHDANNKINSIMGGMSRTLRLGLQIAILGLGGYLVLQNEMTAGMIFAASLISGRALQPIDQLIGGWRGFTETSKAMRRLSDAIDSQSGRETYTELPTPAGRLDLEQIVVFAPNAKNGDEPLLKRLSASIPAGDCVAIIGSSGAGKSTLVRALIGAARVQSGAVRIDGTDIRNWEPKTLGRHVGYLAQDVELLPGTIAENISRFEPDPDDAAIISAAKKAHVHDLIKRFPMGYDTMVGAGHLPLSGGQRQRIGLARAFFGDPKILVLDEPNANLDAAGDQALEQSLATAKDSGVSVVIVTQRKPIAERADWVMIIADGALQDFGPREAVYKRQADKVRAAQAKRAAGADSKVVAGHFANRTVVDQPGGRTQQAKEAHGS